jgi:hypothetical protein
VAADARITEVLSRTRALVEGAASTEQIVTQLRGEGFSLVESIAGLIRARGMTGAEARDAVVDSPTWADARETVESHRWIEPRNPPGQGSLERLRAACDADPRIVEAWFTGRRMTRADGSVREHDGLAVILAEAFQGAEPITRAQIELIERLSAADSDLDIGGWMFTTHRVSSDVSRYGVLIYRSPDRAT